MSTTNASPIELHPPASSHPSLVSGGFDASWFMGSWGVAWSTLPMWKGKKDVVIKYDQPSADYTSFDSSVSSLKESASQGSSPSVVRGRETLTKDGPNAATYDWQGKSWLFFVHSHWEVLGYGKDEPTGLEWAVTFFSKTLFTPSGLDIYIRNSPSASPRSPAEEISIRADLVGRIATALREVEGVSELAKGGFEVPGAPVQGAPVGGVAGDKGQGNGISLSERMAASITPGAAV